MQGLIAIIPLKGKLSDNRFDFPKNFTRLGYSLIVCCIITMICTILLFSKSEKEEDEYKTILKSELSTRDSIHQKRIDQANEKYILKLDSNNKNTIELLAKYGLKYDSSQKVIAKLVQDSSKRNITIINGDDPVLMFCSGSGIYDVIHRKDTLFFKIKLCSEKATSKIEELKVTTLGSKSNYLDPDPNNFKLLGKDKIIQDKYSQVESNSISEIEINYSPVPYYSMIFVRIYGTYYNSDKSKKFTIDVIYGYDIEYKKFGAAMPITNRRIRDTLSHL